MRRFLRREWAKPSLSAAGSKAGRAKAAKCTLKASNQAISAVVLAVAASA